MPIVTNRTIEGRVRVKPISRAGEPKALLQRARLLDREDRLLVELVLQGNVTRKKLSEVFQIKPGTVSRRLQTLAARLNDPLVIDLLDDSCPLAPEYRQVGVEHFLLRHSAVAIAEKHAMALRDTRDMLIFIRGWHRGIRAQRDWGKLIGANRRRGRRGKPKPHVDGAGGKSEG